MVLQGRPPPKSKAPAATTGGTAALQCVASLAGTLLGEVLGPSLPAKLAAGVLGALIGAFLTAPGKQRRRRIVAVALVLALLDLLRRAAGARADERPRDPAPWVPASWAVVGVTAAVGFAGGSAVTTVRAGWAHASTSLVSVPQVRGEPQGRAATLLTDAGLRVTTTTEPSRSVPGGSATRTAPTAGTRVASTTDVTLFISSGPPATTVKVPDVTGLSSAVGQRVLRDVGLRPRQASEPSSSIDPGHVTRTSPPAGAPVRRGTAVTLFVSTGGTTSDTVTVPSVRGRSRADAIAQLDDAGVHAQVRLEQSVDVTAGFATRTDPPAGARVQRGAPVTLFLSSGRPPATVAVPDVTGLPADAADGAIRGAGLDPTDTEEHSTSIKPGVVIRTDPVAGKQVDQGSGVTVVVSSGPPPLTVPDVVGLSDPPDTVIATDPSAGTEVQRGAPVQLHISCIEC